MNTKSFQMKLYLTLLNYYKHGPFSLLLKIYLYTSILLYYEVL